MDLTHFNDNGRAKMVDVGDKENSKREAIATGTIFASPKTIDIIKNKKIKKGDVLAVAQIGGIIGAKKTWDIIPMCHNIPIEGVNIEFEILTDRIIATAKAKTTGKTGIEMEALTAVSTTCLTIYDMCKAIDKDMVISDIKLIKKTGGKSDYFLEK